MWFGGEGRGELVRQVTSTVLAAAPLDDEPGATFCYSNSAMQVAGAVVEAVTGKCWHQVSGVGGLEGGYDCALQA
jgi:CubicO group peptidase (beta-lactamase class C family)